MDLGNPYLIHVHSQVVAASTERPSESRMVGSRCATAELMCSVHSAVSGAVLAVVPDYEGN